LHEGSLKPPYHAKDPTRRIACYASMGFHRRVLKPIASAFKNSLVSGDIGEIESWRPDVIVVADGPPIPLLREYCDAHNAILIGLQHGAVNRYSIPEQEYRLVHYFCGSEWDIQRFSGKGVVPSEKCLLTGNPWVDGVFAIPRRELRKDAPTILFAPTYNPEISAAGFFEGKLVDLIRGVYPANRIIIKPHPAILQYDHPYVLRHRSLFERWVRNWRQAAERHPNVIFVQDENTAISDFFSEADILISDGSSLIFEFMTLDRPILLYTSGKKVAMWEYDPEAPGNSWRDVGIEFSSEEEFTSALRDAFCTHEKVHSAIQRRRTEELYGEFTDGRSVERVVRAIEGLPYLDVLVMADDEANHIVEDLKGRIGNVRIHVVAINAEAQTLSRGTLLNRFFSSSTAERILVIDQRAGQRMGCAGFVYEAVQRMTEDSCIAAAGRIRGDSDTEYVESSYCIFDRQKILEIGGFPDVVPDDLADAELSARITKRGYQIRAAWDERPVVQFLRGFYEDHGGVRWMADEAVMAVGRSVSDASDCAAMTLRFDVNCARLGYYRQFPFVLRVFRGDDLVEEVRFDRACHKATVELPLSAESCRAHRIRLISEESYVPAEVGLGADPRRLSVQISNVCVLEDTERPASVEQPVHREGPKAVSQLPSAGQWEPEQKPARLIAFYLPAFHEIPENDRWWGEGFTEWDNVKKGEPLFPGHYQPHVPGELGYYDLRSPETRKAQAELARNYGIEGFCYWHYWFNGRRLLEAPFNEVLESGEPDLPFCLAWANEDWTRSWDGRSRDILRRQGYGGEADDTAHFEWLLKAFTDRRYMAVDGKQLFLIYRPADLPDAPKTVALWRQLAESAGLPGLFLVAIRTCFDSAETENWVKRGFDSQLMFQPSFNKIFSDHDRRKLSLSLLRLPRNAGRDDEGEHAAQATPDPEKDVVVAYDGAWPSMAGAAADEDNCIPCVLPQWDNSPRRKRAAFILKDSSPEAYEKWLKLVIGRVRPQEPDHRLVFINAWNEWGEGNHLEPDQKFGRGYLEATRRALVSETVALLYAAGKTDDAIRQLEKLLALDSDHSQMHNDLGVLYCEKGNVEKALFHLERALSLDENDGTARKNLADLHAATGQTEKAVPLYERALADNPDDVETLLALANLSCDAGRSNDASTFYARVLAVDDGNTEARARLEQLRRSAEDSASLQRLGPEAKTSLEDDLGRDLRIARLPTVHVPLSDVCAQLRRSSQSASAADTWRGTCLVCGAETEFAVTNPDNLRESLPCTCCGSISRDRMLVCALRAVLGETGPLKSWKPDSSRRVFEASSFRAHAKLLPKLCDHFNTQYVPEKMQEQYDNREYADLQQMPYRDGFFDVLMLSDVFEHVRLYREALHEVYRVLKPGGVMLLQVPFRPDGDTITRVQPDGDEDIFLMEPIYHAQDTLVYRIYGRDFLTEVQDAGFELEYVETEMPEFGIARQSIIICRKPAPAGESAKPKVSIIIPVFNNLGLTRNCLQAIFTNTQGPEYEVIVVDNASTDGTAEYLKGMQSARVRCIFNSENKGFVEACNAAAELAVGDYLLFLNNDTEVQQGWLSSLVEFADKKPDRGAVGSKLVYPTGKLQEAGCITFSDGHGWNYGRHGSPTDPRFNFVREVDYCSGAALMVRTDLWRDIGGFDRRFAPAYYEDTDLCFQIRERGFKVYYQPKSVVIHHEGRTAGTQLQSGYKRYQLENRAKFVEKWASTLSRQYANDPRNVVTASNRQAQRSILVVDPLLPMFDRASGSLRLFSILKLLKQMDFHVTFVARNGSLEDRYRPILEDLGIEVYAWDAQGMRSAGFDITGVPPINYELLLQERSFDYAVLSYWHLAELYLPLLRRLSPQTRMIVDTVDIHFIRETREAEVKGDAELKEKALYNRQRELAVYQKADRLWVVTPEDRQAIEGLVGGKPIDVIPNVHEEIEAVKEFDNTSDLLFVGNFNHPPNEDAVRYFCGEVLPVIVKDLPEVKLYIVGNNPTDHVKALASERVIVTGYVPDLTPYLMQARISVSPLRYGAGMKGKVGEALSWGLPVVTTSMGAEGMELVDGQDVLIGDTAEQFAACVVRLYTDKELWTQLSRNGKSKVEGRYSPKAVKGSLETVFQTAEPASSDRLVSIVILAHNQLSYTKLCLESIQRHTRTPYELVLVDNGSTDGTDKFLARFRRRWEDSRGDSEADHCGAVKVLRHEENLGYAAGNNSGIAAADGDYILLLNNDVVVTPGWLERALGCAEKDPGLGIVGPVTNRISGPQQVEQVTYDTSSLNGLDEFAARWTEEHFGETKPFWRVVGFCMLIKRAVVEKIGGLDTRYGLGNFEDDDFSIRAAIAGFRSVIASDCFVHHFGSRTFAGQRINYQELLLKNWEIFKQKWGLPADLVYGAACDLSNVVRQPFDPDCHFCPVAPDASGQASGSSDRWFAAPKWAEAGTWQPIVEEFARSNTPRDGTLLQLYAGSLTRSDPEKACGLVAEYLQRLGVDEQNCPDIEITNDLPKDPSALIILAGGTLDDRLQTQFSSRCVRLSDWRQAA